MIQGDRNTSFYHISTLVRRKRNCIEAIKNQHGDWVHEERAVMNIIREGFAGLFSTSKSSSRWIPEPPTQWQATIQDLESHNLNLPISEDEVKGALWSMKAFKASGPDGLHAGFFQRFWHTVGNSLIEEVRKCFAEKNIPDYLNQTLMVLIPKIHGPETLGNYRPISLCNTAYKVITKIIANRIRPVLSSIISPLQTAFVPGRRGTDNAIIVQELVHTIGKAKGKEGYMAIKIDLEKAYDKLEWDFIRERLICANFPMDLIQTIMCCVTTATTSILFNGGTLDPLTPTRGIRQGDPLSPYLFILCIDFLGQLIEGKCAEKAWDPVKSSKSGPFFSHLFFADDLVLFAKANSKNCSAIRSVLDIFCSKSGETISEAKSKVYFSPNVDSDMRDSLCEILGFRSTNSLGKYLGIPIRQQGSSPNDFNFILDKMKQKLAGWKSNLLSMAGRAVLIQSSLSTIPAYVMQCASLPSKIHKGIDRISRNFLWGSTESVRKMHWVGWSKITKPKEEGGLGFQTAKGRNTALLAKLNWRFNSEKDSLWAQVLRKKYCTRQRLNSNNTHKLPCSQVWKGIKVGQETFQKGVRWTLGHNSNLSLWYDKWSSSGPLRLAIQGPLTREEDNFQVKDVLSLTGWSWEKVSLDIPTEIKLEIQATPSALSVGSMDKMCWSGDPKGSFNLKSAYRLAVGNEINNFDRGWIWQAKTLPRIQIFVWRCLHNSLGVKTCLNARGLSIDPLCPLCQKHPETIIHSLRDCDLVKEVWANLGVQGTSSGFYGSTLNLWLSENAKAAHTVGQHNLPWKSVFLFAIWTIWKRRNLLVFQNKPLNSNLHSEILHKVLEFTHCAVNIREATHHVLKPVRWEKPAIGWRKLNSDGSSLGNPGRAGGGGLIWDEEGNWVLGYSRQIGITSSFIAELWALRDGLMMCVDRNFPAVVVEMDAKVIIEVLNNPNNTNLIISSIVDDCRKLASRIPRIQFEHCYREANRSADMLARMGANQSSSFSFHSSPPEDVKPLLDFDISELYLNRRCPVPLVFF